MSCDKATLYPTERKLTMKTRKNLFKLLALAVMLTVMIGALAVLGISAGAEDVPAAENIKVTNGDVEVLFSSWYEMIEYINQNDGCTVTLLGDVVVDNETWITNNLTIDLAGYKLSNFSAKSKNVF